MLKQKKKKYIYKQMHMGKCERRHRRRRYRINK